MCFLFKECAERACKCEQTYTIYIKITLWEYLQTSHENVPLNLILIIPQMWQNLEAKNKYFPKGTNVLLVTVIG